MPEPGTTCRPLLPGLQRLCSDENLRQLLFAPLDRHIRRGISRKTGRPGCDRDRLQELVNRHRTPRRFPGQPEARDDYQYELQAVVDNVGLLSPELLAEISRLIVESGHAGAEKKPSVPLSGHRDSFVALADVHYPTDGSLLPLAFRPGRGRASRPRGQGCRYRRAQGQFRPCQAAGRPGPALASPRRDHHSAAGERFPGIRAACQVDLRGQGPLPGLAGCSGLHAG